MNEVIEKVDIKIESLIYEIRGVQVMLDNDIAKLYEVETKYLNRQVKRNIERFDNDFMFQLTYFEYQNLKCQIGTSSNNYGGRRTLPYVFTEKGVTTLASVLHSNVAINMSKKIIRAFVIMRHYISSNLIEQKYINNLVLNHEERIKLIEDTFSKFQEKNNHIFFEGQIYDAYSLMLDILSKTNKQITLITNQYNNDDYNKYKKQYSNIDLIINNKIHDRFIIIDRKTLYHCGASFKDLGKKCFAISKIDDKSILETLLKNIKK